MTNPKATSDQKAAAVTKVAEATATSSLKAGAKKAVKSAKLQKAKGAAVSIAKRVPVGGVLYPFIAAAQAAKVDPKKFEAAKKTDAAMQKVKATLKKSGQKLSRKDEQILAKQHYEYFLKNP